MTAKYPFVMPDDWLCCVQDVDGSAVIVTKSCVGDFIQFVCMVLDPTRKSGRGESCRRHKDDPPLIWDLHLHAGKSFRFFEERHCNASLASLAYYRELHECYARDLDAGNPDYSYPSLSQYSVLSTTRYDVRHDRPTERKTED